MCYNFATFVLYLDVITLIYRENRLTSSETSLSALTLVKSIFYERFFISKSKFFSNFTDLMDEMELMMHLYQNNKRQGPGSDETTLLALQLAHFDSREY